MRVNSVTFYVFYDLVTYTVCKQRKVFFIFLSIIYADDYQTRLQKYCPCQSTIKYIYTCTCVR